MPVLTLLEGYQNERVFQAPVFRSSSRCYACGGRAVRLVTDAPGWRGIHVDTGGDEYAAAICGTCEAIAREYVVVGGGQDRLASFVTYCVAPWVFPRLFAELSARLSHLFPTVVGDMAQCRLLYFCTLHASPDDQGRFYYNGPREREELESHGYLEYAYCRACCNHSRNCDCFVDVMDRWVRVCSRCGVGTVHNRCACVRPQNFEEIWIESPIVFKGEQDKAPKRYIGVEFELAGGDFQHKARDFANGAKALGCTIKRDGSLDGYGIELITPPCRGKAYRQLMSGLDFLFKEFNVYVDSSCGGHVHVDATGFDRDDGPTPVAKLLALWAKLEPVLMAGTIPARARGTYTKRWGFPARRTVGKWVRELEAVTEHFRPSRSEHWFRHPQLDLVYDRYRALNFVSFRVHHTLEFRHWDGTADGKEGWMRGYIGDKILQAATTWSPLRVDSLIKLEGTELIHAVAGKRAKNYMDQLIATIPDRNYNNDEDDNDEDDNDEEDCEL